jgi:type ii restriction enzyme, methylase subunit
MDKVALRNFAVNAKEKMEDDIKRKLELMGITEKGIGEETVKEDDYLKINGQEFNKKEVKQREKIIEVLKVSEKDEDFKKYFNEFVEEIAYTWFNRIIAIRFMEVNDYIPDGIRILSSDRENDREPQIVREVFDTDLEFSNDEKNNVYKLKEENKIEELFKFLFIKKCNKLNEILPELFEEAEDYSELLLPISINDEEGILRKLVDEVPEESFDVEKEGQIEVIGWLYQYYNEEKKKEVDLKIKKGKKVEQDDIPAKTQLFTPKWIVKYMVENSLGNLWLEGHPNENLEEKWKFLVKGEKQEEEIEKKLEKLNENYKEMKLEEIKIIDPCMGSGHILVYAFDVLMDIYLNLGYSNRDAVQSILENNIYGLDIDKRAYQLAYFALMMKAREYYKRIFSKKLELNICYTRESNDINKEIIDFISNGNNKIKEELDLIYNSFLDVREYGSLIEAPKIDYDKIKNRLSEIENTDFYNLFDELKKEEIKNKFYYVIKTSEILSKKYEVVTTNPPYMGSSMMDSKLSKYTKKNYPDSKSDMFAVFIEKCNSLTDRNGFCSMITMHGWMFLSSYERLREKMALIETLNMVHLGTRAFDEIGGEVVQTTVWIQRKNKINNFKGSYIRLVDFPGEKNKRNKFLETVENKDKKYYFRKAKENFEKIPGIPIGYWASEKLIKNFEKSEVLYDYSISSSQNITGNNTKYLRFYWEVEKKKISKNLKWIFYAKGGKYRKWTGNLIDLVNWTEKAREEYKKGHGSQIIPEKFWYKKGITWGLITSNEPSFRILPEDSTFDKGGSSIFIKNNENFNYILSLLNSVVFTYIVEFFNPTINFQVKDIRSIPLKFERKKEVDKAVKEILKISKYDWNTFETAWDFKVNPLVNFERYIENYNLEDEENSENKKVSSTSIKTIKEAYSQYKEFTNNQFLKLKKNEEELNRIFIDIYGLQDELTSDVSDKDITIAKIFDTDDEINDEIKGNSYVLTKENVVKQFISYAVGCMFGRYSLDEEGLVFAGGEFDKNKYIKFIPDEDNCIPITDSEYFSDDIVTRFVEFVKTVYGEETLEENLKFISQALSNKNDAPKDIIREYFLKSFYDDHLKRYKKRPIYWLYDAGKKNGFKALIYMHRYNEQTTAKVRIGYLHELQKHYERRASFLKDEIESNNNRKKAEQELKKIKSQLDECKQFDEKMNHLSSEYISIDLDDGVKVNYEKVQTGRDGKKYEILGKVK